MPKSIEATAHIRTHQERVFRRRGFFDINSRAPEKIDGLKTEHRDRRKELRSIQRQMEEEKAKKKGERDMQRLAELTAQYNAVSAEQGAVRRALDITAGRRRR